MPVSKRRLRWIILIILLVFPLTLISGFVWFVASDTWMQRDLEQLSQRLGFTVDCDDLRLAGTQAYQYDTVSVRDEAGQTLLQTPRMLIASQQVGEQHIKQIQIDQAAITIQPNSLLNYLQLLAVYAQAPELCLLDIKAFTCSGLQGSIAITQEAQLQIQATGVLNQEQLFDWSMLLQASPYVERLPDFMFDDQLTVESLSANVDILQLTVEWSCVLHWPHGSAQIRFDGQSCIVESFSDSRLPLFSVKQEETQVVSLCTLSFQAVQLEFDIEQQALFIQANGSGDDAWRIQVDPQTDAVTCRLLRAQWPDGFQVLEPYLPQWLSAQLPKSGALDGTTWQWDKQGRASGQLQVRADSYFLRSDWRLETALRLENVLLKLPSSSWQCTSVSCSDRAIHARTLTPLQMPDSFSAMWQVLAFSDVDLMAAGDWLLFVHDKDAIRMDKDGHLQLQAAQVPAASLTNLGVHSFFTAGSLSDVSVIDAGADLRIKAKIDDAQCAWPIADFRLRGVDWSYVRNDNQERWHIQSANIVLAYSVSGTEQAGQWTVRWLQWQWDPMSGFIAELLRLVDGK